MQKNTINRFQEVILTWFAKNQRNLPWRKTHDPYAVLVSEVMLQQTQVDRVINYWTDWLERWPTFEVLATAPTADIIRAWAGLGYNRRAVNLQRAARFVIKKGGFDQFRSVKDLETIPGVGHGTAGALMNFVWNVDTPFLEVNIKRILQRLAYGPETVVGWATNKELQDIAQAVLPQGQARIWPHALMDFGALACRPRDGLCEKCPLGALVSHRNQKLLKQSNLKFRSSKLAKKTVRFEESNRYWRGRILDVLRQTPRAVRANQLHTRLANHEQLQPLRYKKLLIDLTRDGLITITPKGLALP